MGDALGNETDLSRCLSRCPFLGPFLWVLVWVTYRGRADLETPDLSTGGVGARSWRRGLIWFYTTQGHLGQQMEPSTHSSLASEASAVGAGDKAMADKKTYLFVLLSFSVYIPSL